MSKSITVSYGGAPCYDILLEQDFQALTAQLQKAGLHSGKKACIVTDEKRSRRISPGYLSLSFQQGRRASI